MHKREMVEAMLGKIEQAIERLLDNSRPIDSYHYYLVSPGGMERLESTCMLLMAIGEGLKEMCIRDRYKVLCNARYWYNTYICAIQGTIIE